MSAATRWTLAIVALLGGNLVAMLVLATTASREDAQVIPDYYEKAVHYDDTIDEAARSEALGWSAEATLFASTLEVRILDRAGNAVTGARVHVDGYPRAHAVDRIDTELVATAPGVYRAHLAGNRLGWHDLRIIVDHEGRRFTQQVTVEGQ